MDPMVAWSMFFSSVVTMQYHPGAGRGDHVVYTVTQCAAIADLMLHEFSRRQEVLCRGSDLQ